MTNDITRSFPHSLPAEKSTLSNMLQSGAEMIGRAVEAGITTDHYYDPGRAIIFDFLCERVDAGLPTDIETMISSMHDDERETLKKFAEGALKCLPRYRRLWL